MVDAASGVIIVAASVDGSGCPTRGGIAVHENLRKFSSVAVFVLLWVVVEGWNWD